MKIAIVGSRNCGNPRLGDYIESIIPLSDIEIIISGGARGIDSLAAEYANNHNIQLVEIKPDYQSYGKAAPIIRNKQIVDSADMIIAFWDGESRGTKSVIDYSNKKSKNIKVFRI